ncbi:MAG: hypothetical protein EPN93_07885 [Spirochaetes bacterium]|nr:MAG: hypothetical protein EPN93_07885 [Spirochaetota bacterium]
MQGIKIGSISKFSQNLSDSTGVQKENARRISQTIESVNTGAQEFAARSEELSLSSNELRDKLKQFRL